MAIPLEQFVKHLADSGILAGDTLQAFLPPQAFPKDAEELVRELVRRKKLTKFQAEEVWRGKGKSLVLGNYLLLEKIGQGGMGAVYKAEHRRMHRIVAIKMLPAAMTRDPAAIARFEREVTAAAKLRHPNIVAADDADQANGVHFLVMEFVDGSDLSAFVKKNGPFSVDMAVNCILQAARGLEFAHKKGVVHRDIKPANLLLDAEGTVKILDMGLARIESVGDAAPQADLTNTGAIMGTVDYMPPEQALDTKTADARADIYSLGGTLFYLLSGKAMYPGDTLMKKLVGHREQPIPSIQTLRPEVSDEVEAVYCKMVAKRVEDRYQTMTEVLAELERCFKGHEPSINTQHPFGSSTEEGITDFLKEILAGTPKPVLPKNSPGPLFGKNKKQLLLIGGGVLGVLVLLAGLVVKLRTREGTLIVTVNEPDANVQVLSEEGTVEVTRQGDQGPITISVDPGKHRLKVTKEGFEFFTQDFSIESGGRQPIVAKLVPLEDKPVVAETKPAPVAGGKKPLAFEASGFELWVKEVAALPAERQVEAVAKKLQELNPGFDGTVTPTIQYGVLTKLEFLTDNVTDISPVRALVGMKKLHCRGTYARSARLSDLSPLAGMMLTYLDCSWTQVSSLSILRGMPITHLRCNGSKISDVSPLEGMPLAELICGNTKISDLSPLARITTLRNLDLRSTLITAAGVAALQKTLPNCKIEWDDPAKTTTPDKPITTFHDPAFQQWMKDVAELPAEKQVEAVSKKLMELNPGFDGKVTGHFGKGTPKIENGVVTQFGFDNDSGTRHVTDISPLRALGGLNSLWCGLTRGQLADLSPLTGMQLVVLVCPYTTISDLSPLIGMKLEVLDCGATQVSDLSPLKGMPLGLLGVVETPVSDISMLQGMVSLKRLMISSTQVTDLRPLQGMRLDLFYCEGVLVSDLSLLKGMPLKHLSCDFKPFRDTELLRSITTLETINHKPTAEFWKEVAEKQAAFEAWTKQVAALPAEKQVEAVAKKLQELNKGFDGKVTHMIEDGEVTELQFVTDHVTDISPVRALEGLKRLVCNGSSQGKGRLSDLSPLNGTKLTLLNCGWSPSLADLSPLKGVPLTNLNFICTSVADLSPLAGMPLTSLRCVDTRVADLSLLRGLPLTILDCGFTKITDLSPLAGMQLSALGVEATPVADLSPLKDMPLTYLGIYSTQVSDLSPLKTMPLVDFECNGTPIASLSPLKDVPLKTLFCDFKPFRDTELLHSIKTLETINGKPAAKFWKEVETQRAAVEAWTKQVAAMPAEKQVEAVAKKLVELNPGFDGIVTPTLEEGVVAGIQFLTDNVTDISPARALKELSFLGCAGSAPGQGKLVDLSPLRGLALTVLHIYYNKVSDLSPLKGMPLTDLATHGIQVSDLSPLKGMPLRWLKFDHTPVADLTPLTGMPLTFLAFNDTQVADLSPLQGLPLETLEASGTRISDLTVLKGMPLKKLSFSQSSVTDLSPLENMSLSALGMAQTHVADLSLLKDMPLKSVLLDFKPEWDTELLRSVKTLETINYKPAAEFWVEEEAYRARVNKPLGFETPGFDEWVQDVAGMPAEEQVPAVARKFQELNPGFDGKVTPTIEVGVVTHLLLSIDNVTDISPVRALAKLTNFQCSGSGIQSRLSDLSPLKGLPLTVLMIQYARVSDLSPLQGSPLSTLYLTATQVSDLSPLKDVPLRALVLNISPVSELSPLRGVPLADLNIDLTLVSDVSAVQGMPLTNLICSRTKVADFTALKDLPLKAVTFDFKPARDTELLRSIKTLEAINGKPAAEFWKDVEGKKEGGKP